MAKVKMKLVNIISDLEHLDEVLSRFIKLDNFHPELSSKIASSVHGLTTMKDENPYIKVREHIRDVGKNMGINITPVLVESTSCDINKISEYGAYIEETQGRYNKLCEHVKEIEQLVREDEAALVQVKNIESLDVSLDDLFSCKYIVARVGSLPSDSMEKLKYHYKRPFIWNSFTEDRMSSTGIYITTNANEREVDNIFASLFFERTHIPDFVHGTPERAKENLQEEINSLKKSLQKLENQKEDLLGNIRDSYSAMTSELENSARIFEARKYVVDFGERVSITGFIQEKDALALCDTFRDLQKVEIEILPPDADVRLSPPKKLNFNWK